MKKSVYLAAVFAAFPISAVLAADLPSKKQPAIAPVPVPTWTGFHVGLNAGGTRANNDNIGAASSSFYVSPIDPPANRAGPRITPLPLLLAPHQAFLMVVRLVS